MYLCASEMVVACKWSCFCVLVESFLAVNVMDLSASGIVVACERSCICLLVESMWPVIGYVFVCLLNRCL